MSTNHTATQLSAELCRLSIEAQSVADRLASEPLSSTDAALELSAPIVTLAAVLSTLEAAAYSAENFGGERRAEDLAIARMLAKPNVSRSAYR